MGANERGPSKKESVAMQKVDKTHISLGPSLRTYKGAKQEALKGHFLLKIPLKKRLHKKLESQWATPMIFKIGITMGHSHDIQKEKYVCLP